MLPNEWKRQQSPPSTRKTKGEIVISTEEKE